MQVISSQTFFCQNIKFISNIKNRDKKEKNKSFRF